MAEKDNFIDFKEEEEEEDQEEEEEEEEEEEIRDDDIGLNWDDDIGLNCESANSKTPISLLSSDSQKSSNKYLEDQLNNFRSQWQRELRGQPEFTDSQDDNALQQANSKTPISLLSSDSQKSSNKYLEDQLNNFRSQWLRELRGQPEFTDSQDDNALQQFRPRSLQRPAFLDEALIFTTEQRNYLQNENGAEAQANDKEFRCIECVKALPVYSSNGIEAGDHVVFCGAVYDHHGIVISKSNLNDEIFFNIVEINNTMVGAVLGMSFSGGKANILFSTKKIDFERQKICVVDYKCRFSKQVTASRAFHFFFLSRDDFKYNLFDNNCEHFATFCVTGQKISVQASKFRLTWKLFWSSGFVGISDELKRNEKEYENDIICKDCYEMNKKLLGVDVKPIVSEGDVQKGDIIRYSYWNLWHDAVVLEVSKKTKKAVVCSIAHYAFCGPFSHRTIIVERKEIQLNGQCSKLDYAPPEFDVYEPEKVVRRARMRLREQLFVFFSNDSSHFARWCKLKLWRS